MKPQWCKNRKKRSYIVHLSHFIFVNFFQISSLIFFLLVITFRPCDLSVTYHPLNDSLQVQWPMLSQEYNITVFWCLVDLNNNCQNMVSYINCQNMVSYINCQNMVSYNNCQNMVSYNNCQNMVSYINCQNMVSYNNCQNMVSYKNRQNRVSSCQNKIS